MVTMWRFLILSQVVVTVLARYADGRQKVRIMSDVHAGSCWQGNQSDLFAFLEQTAKDDVDVIVLNGDIYDFWLVPLHNVTPSFNNSIEHGLNPAMGFDMARFRDLLHKAAKSVVKLHEDNGNHDMWLTEDLAQKAIGSVPVLWEDDIVEKWGVRFEHGHMNSLFNRAPPGTDLMPIGYYVTRIVATYTCKSADGVSKMLSSVIEGLLGTSVLDALSVELLRQPYAFKKLLRHILQTAADGKLPDDLNVPVVGVVSPSQIPKGGDASANYTLAHFVEDYADVLEKFVAEYGFDKCAQYIEADVVDGALDRNVGRDSINESVVVLGHTHIPSLQLVQRDNPQWSNTPEVLVANAGAWVKNDAGISEHSYVDITLDDIVQDFPECYTSKNGSDYRGRTQRTVTGKDCVAWGGTWTSKAAGSPSSINGSSVPSRCGAYCEAFGRKAFCRNMGEAKQPWCWTGEFHWDKCDVGPPAKKCEVEKVRGAVVVQLFSFPNKIPVSFATRKNASTGSSWTLESASASKSAADVKAIVV